jgi:hypothetical protein
MAIVQKPRVRGTSAAEAINRKQMAKEQQTEKD